MHETKCQRVSELFFVWEAIERVELFGQLGDNTFVGGGHQVDVLVLVCVSPRSRIFYVIVPLMWNCYCAQ